MAFDEQHGNLSGGDVFLSAINTTGSIKDANHIVIEVKRYIAELHSRNAIQVCFNNATAMKNAASNISYEWLHVYWQRWMMHSLNLLLKDWRIQ